MLARKQYDGVNAQRLRKLFLTNRKACVQELLEGRDSPRCNIPLETLTDQFQKEYVEGPNNLENPLQWLTKCLKAGDNPPEWDSVSISAQEVKNQLKCLPGNTAPGPDHLPYKVWKAIDPSGSILAKILEICRLQKRIPKSWKESTTILLYKKGDKSVPSNWRLISLQNAVYKIYAALWAKRLVNWASETEIISPCQKGFMPGEGCSEHAFLLRSLMEDARRNHNSLYSVWFDLKNAFWVNPS